MDTKLISFTKRQQEILWILYENPDLTDKELATRLGITRATLATHLYMIRDRLHVRSTMGLLVTLIKDGWFEPDRTTVKHGWLAPVGNGE